MSKEQWDEEHFESLFKQAPKVTDHRTKDEVLKRLIDEGVFNEQPPQKQEITKKQTAKKIRWTPIVASVASLFIIGVIGAQFLNEPNVVENIAFDATEQKLETTKDSFEITAEESQEAEADVTSEMMERSVISNFTVEMSVPQTLVYASQLEGVTLFEIGLVDEAEAIPVSFLIPNEVVAETLHTESPTKLQLYEAFAPLIDEVALGFSEFHPLKGTFRENGEQLNHVLPNDHSYDVGSAAISNYMTTLVDTFALSYKEVFIENENGEPAQFDQIGELTEPILLQPKKQHVRYFTYQKQDGTYYLTPNVGTTEYATAQEALQNMKVENGELYKSVILPDVTYEVQEQEGLVTITFTEPLDIMQYDANEVMRMLEGLLLTAASYDKHVKFEQIVQQHWSGFDFTNPLEKPLAPNLVFYNF